jgi:hypothetical protein
MSLARPPTELGHLIGTRLDGWRLSEDSSAAVGIIVGERGIAAERSRFTNSVAGWCSEFAGVGLDAMMAGMGGNVIALVFATLVTLPESTKANPHRPANTRRNHRSSSPSLTQLLPGG